jgi:hypothetical protein
VRFLKTTKRTTSDQNNAISTGAEERLIVTKNASKG